MGVGTTSPEQRLHLAKAGNVCSLRADTYRTTGVPNAPAVLQLIRSGTDTLGAKSVTNSGNSLGFIEFYGVNSTGGNFAKAATIEVVQDGSAGSSYNPAKIDLKTSPGTTIPQ